MGRKSKSLSLVGNEAKLAFIDRYRNIDRVCEKDEFFRRKKDPVTAYLQRLS
jgi:hypothetical protein